MQFTLSYNIYQIIVNKNASFFKGGERKLVLSALILGRETSVLSYFFVIDIAIIAFLL